MQNIWLRRILILFTLSFVIGAASSVFLWGLEQIDQTRKANAWFIYFLPVLGIGFHYLYQKGFSFAKTGNNQLIEKLNHPDQTISSKVGPFLLISTWLSHLVGASVGREGTAVLLGGSFADILGKRFLFKEEEKNVWIRAGISAGFSSVFGTPLAGLFFGVELAKVGKIDWKSFLPCLFAGFLANWTSLHVFGTKHPLYPSIFLPAISPTFCASVISIGIILGIIAFIYIRLESIIYRAFEALPRNFYLKGLCAGAILLLFFQLPYFQESIGLGSEYLLRPFYETTHFDFVISKMGMTLMSLGLGFKGGEATPLFLIGSQLASSFAPMLDIPTGLSAAIGFTCLYGGLCKTPIAASFMGIELFGVSAGLCYLICTIIVMYVSGKKGLFKTQIWSEHIPQPLY
jgi:H+/Cl- antiporter ClcA